MAQGWICLHRQLLEWEWYDDINACRLFIHCLLRANHKDKNWKGRDIKRGQFWTSLETLSQETGLSHKQVRGAFLKLEKTGEVASKGQARGRMVTVLNYESYQQEGKLKGKLEGSQGASSGQAQGRLGATNNNDNNGDNDNNTDKEPDLFGDQEEEKAKPVPYKKIKDEYNKILFDRPKIEIMSDTRKTKLKSIWNMEDNFQNLEFWSGLFTYIRDSDFLMGKTQNYPGCNFDFILQQSSFIKIYEGFYHQETNQGQR